MSAINLEPPLTSPICTSVCQHRPNVRQGGFLAALVGGDLDGARIRPQHVRGKLRRSRRLVALEREQCGAAFGPRQLRKSLGRESSRE